MIPYGRQTIDDDDIAAVVAALRSDFLTQGPAVGAFETALCAATGARFAVAFCNGTAALHAAMWAAGIGPDDVVATPALTFAASVNAARYVGASVRFVDIDPSTLNLDTAAVPTDVDALVAVHYAGLPVDMSTLVHRPRVVIEDAAHAIGASTPDGPVGNCAQSDMCCFSFHPVKTITTGEGGAVTTNDPTLAERLRRFRHHGIVKADDGPFWRYDIPELGFNYRLTDLQAALGASQLTKLERFVDRRNAIADRYRAALAGREDVRLPPPAPAGSRHAYHLFPIRVAERDRVLGTLRDRGIGAQLHYVPAYEFGAYAGHGSAADFPETASAADTLLSLPMYPTLTDDEVDLVVATLLEAL